MQSKIIDKNSIYVVAEEFDDLLTLRRIIKKNDQIVGSTTWSLKKNSEYIRPDKTERIKIKIVLQVEKITMVVEFNRLQISGKIIETNNEFVSHGAHNSLYIQINEGVKIIKRNWGSEEKDLIQRNKNMGFLLLSVERGNYSIGIIKGTHLQIYPDIRFGSTGKRYKSDFNVRKFFDMIKNSLLSITLDDYESVIIFGPGDTKNKICNYLQTNLKNKMNIKVADGIESGGEDGIHIFVKSTIMKDIMSESKLAKVVSIINEIMFLANKKSEKFTMGFVQTKMANECNSIKSIVFSYKIMEMENEEEIIGLLNSIEKKGAKIYSVDSSTDLGLRVTKLGGIVALLRFAIAI
ncbi:MAG: pelota family protein [Nitrosopumilaceae archaeon]|nr:pelota family protein [Nitrosopumilaceae archaeon]